MQVLICEAPAVLPDGTPSCDAWQTVAYESLALKTDLFPFEEYLGFDGVLFGKILAGLLITFITGHVGGIIVRNMNRV